MLWSFRFRYYRCVVVRDHDHHIHVCASDHTEKGVHVLLVHSLLVRGDVRTDVVARVSKNNGATEVLEILHRPGNHIHPGQGGESEDQIHGVGYTRNRTAAVRRAQSEILPSAELQIPFRPVGAPELYCSEVDGIPLVHADLSPAREFLVVPHKSTRAVDVEVEKFLRSEQHQSGVPSAKGTDQDQDDLAATLYYINTLALFILDTSRRTVRGWQSRLVQVRSGGHGRRRYRSHSLRFHSERFGVRHVDKPLFRRVL